MVMNIIVVGSGGREHTICWKLAQSSVVDKIFVVPGNGGTANESKCVNVNPKDCDYIKDGTILTLQLQNMKTVAWP